MQTLDDFKDSVTRVLLTHHKVVASSVDGFIRLFDLRMGKLLRVGMPGKAPANGFDLSKLDESYCVVSGLDSITRIVDVDQGKLLAEYKGGHTQKQYHGSVKFSKDN